MAILGAILLALGLILGLKILWVIGLVLLVVGIVLLFWPISGRRIY